MLVVADRMPGKLPLMSGPPRGHCASDVYDPTVMIPLWSSVRREVLTVARCLDADAVKANCFGRGLVP